MKRTIRSLTFAVVVGSMLVVGLSLRSGKGGLVRDVQAKEKGCTVATLEGEYLFTGMAQANINQRNDPTYPRIIVGVLTFHEGNLSDFRTQSLGGQEIDRRITFTGTYTLDSDCTGTAHFVTPVSSNWDLFVTRDGSEGNLIRYDDGAIATRSFKKQ